MSAARRFAGLGGHRTRLQELKNAWLKATPAERADFSSWTSASTPALVVSTPATSAWDADGRMLSWAQVRIVDVLERRKLLPGKFALELGLKASDQSVTTSVGGVTRVKPPSVRLAVDRWLVSNAGI